MIAQPLIRSLTLFATLKTSYRSNASQKYSWNSFSSAFVECLEQNYIQNRN